MADSLDGLARDWPLVGRTDALDRFRTLLETAERTDGDPARGIALVGPAGVGKTRLAGGCLDHAERAGWRIGRVAGSQAAASIPFGAAASLLAPDGAGGLDFATIIRTAYSALTERGRLCVMVDDAHLLDDASITLVQHLATSRSVVVVITARSDRPVADAVSALWRGGALARIDLDGLDRPEHDQLVAAALGGPIDESAARRLFAASGGNPLFVRELLMAAAEDNAVFPDGQGGWRIGRLPRSSSRLAELVAGRLGALDDGERRCIETIAVAEPVGIDVITAMGFGPAVARLERRRLVQATGSGMRVDLTIAHPVYADTVRDRLLPIRARNIRRALADQLERTGAKRRGDASRIAGWRIDAGLAVSAPSLIAAADEALVAGDNNGAERFAHAAHEADPSLATALVLARIARRSNDGAAIEALISGAAALPGTVREHTDLVRIRASNAFWNLGHHERAVALLDQLAEPDDAVAQLRTDLRLAAGERAEPADPVGVRAVSLLGEGRFNAALTELRTAPDRSAHSGLESFALVAGGWLAGGVPMASGAPNADRLAPISRSGSSVDEGWAMLARSTRSADDGDGRAALDTVTAAADVFIRTDRRLGIAACAARSIEAHVLLGDLGGARRYLDGCPQHLRTRIFAGLIDTAEARLLVAEGRRSSAADVLRRSADAARAADHADLEQSSVYDLLRLGSASGGGGARVIELALRIETPRAAHRARHVACGDDGAKLGLLAATLEMDGFAVWACEVAIEAVSRLSAAGASRQAGTEQRRVVRLRASFPRAALFAPADPTPAADLQLRPGELHVVRLAARGMSDREIGEQLHLSVRTVGNYLARAYRRLGVRGRDELAQALADNQLLST